MAIKQKNLFGDNTSPGYRLIGVATTEANYKLLENRSSVYEGDLWYDTTNNVLKTYDGTNWSAAGLSSQSAGSLNDAASVGGTITVDGSTVAADFAVTVSDGGGDVCATFTQSDITNNGKCLVLVNEGSAVTLDFTSSGTYDAQGTSDLWDISAAGVGHFLGLTMNTDNENITLGTGGDLTISYNDAAPGSVGSGLLIEGTGADEQVQFGNATWEIDLLMLGTTNANYCHWDASANKLILDNADLIIGDDDQLRFGDATTSGDVLVRWDNTDLSFLPNADGTAMILGTNALCMDLKIWGATATSYFDWYAAGDRLVLASAASSYDTGLQLDDYIGITFGEGANFATTGDGDWQMYCSGASNNPLTLIPTTDNSIVVVGNSGGTKNADLQWYTGGVAGSGLFIDASADKVYLTTADFYLGDNDYICFGAQASAGATSDASVRWDGSVLEVMGATHFEAGNMQVDDNCTITGNLSVGGTLALTGAFSTGDISMADSESLTFGSSDDISMTYNGTSNVLLIEGAAQGTAIAIGYTNSQDFRLFGDTATNFLKYDGTANTVTLDGTDILMLDSDYIRFGDDGEFWMFYDEASTDNLIISSSTANDAVQIGDGTTGTDLKIMNTINASAFILWDDSAETWFFGQATHGVDVHFMGDSGYDAIWDESADTLYFEDNAALGIGASSGTPDLEIISNGTTAAAIMSTNFVLYGDGKDISLGTSGTHGSDLYIKSATADNYIKWDAGNESWVFGTTGGAGTDVVFQSSVTASNKITYDAGAGELQFGDDAILGIGGATNATADLKIYTAGTTTVCEMAADLAIYGESMDIHLGTSGTNGSDVYFHSNTADNYTLFDSGKEAWFFGTTGGAGTDVVFQSSVTTSNKVTYDAGAGELQFGDDAILGIGGATNATADLLIYTAGTSVAMDMAAHLTLSGDGYNITFGNSGTNSSDVTFQSITGPNFVKWDAGAESWTFGGTSVNGCDVVFQGITTSANTVAFNAGTEKWTFGSTRSNSVDVVFEGSGLGTTITWNAGAETWAWDDQVSTYTWDLNFEAATTNMLRLKANDAATSKLVFGTTGTHGLDVVFQSITSANTVAWDAGTETWTFGGTAANGCDVVFQGVTTAANTVKWDAGAESFTFGSTRSNSVDVVFESSYTTASVAWDAGAATLTTEAGTDCRFHGNTTVAASMIKGFHVPIVTAVPTTTTNTIPTGVALVCVSATGAICVRSEGAAWASVAIA